MNAEAAGQATAHQMDSGSLGELYPSPTRPLSATAQSPGSTAGGSPLRRGKWTPEEEAYAQAAIQDFNSGYLDAPPGTTLRTYLSEKLQCDPMRITKKFTGEASIGKKVFHPAANDGPETAKEIEDSKARLEVLYQKWKERLVAQEQEMARKSMAAAAVSAATSLCDNPLFAGAHSAHLLGGVSMRVPPTATRPIGNIQTNNVQNEKAKADIAKTATWLDQAESLLSKKTEDNRAASEIEKEMNEIALLIEESPTILSISAELPKLLAGKHNLDPRIVLGDAIHRQHSCPDLRILSTTPGVEHPKPTVATPTMGKRKRSLSDDMTDSPNNPMKLLASLSSQAAPVPIAPLYGGNHTPTSTEDAKTLVKFMHSAVRNGNE